MTSNELVYLEDVEPARKSVVRTDSTATTAIIASTAESKNHVTSTGAMKRQISIAEMFSKASSSMPSSKRQNVDNGASMVLPRRSMSGVPSLNSVPLNLDAYRASLSEEERKLLMLEMETMGKSWSVSFLIFIFVFTSKFIQCFARQAESPDRRD